MNLSREPTLLGIDVKDNRKSRHWAAIVGAINADLTSTCLPLLLLLLLLLQMIMMNVMRVCLVVLMAFRSGSLRAVSFGNVLLPRDIFTQVHMSAAWNFLPVPYRLQLAVLCQRQFIALRAPLSPHFPFYPFHCPTSLRYGVQVLSISLSLLVWVLVYCILFFLTKLTGAASKFVDDFSWLIHHHSSSSLYFAQRRTFTAIAAPSVWLMLCAVSLIVCLCVCVRDVGMLWLNT